ncbi:MAG: class I SAM-dependent methyltransferase [Planctomycetota bacterium]
MDVDFGMRSGDYAEHRPGFPESFYDRLEGLRPLSDARALDAGTGPGVMALELARRGARVVGIDVAENQILAARQRAAALGLAKQTQFLVAAVEKTGLESCRFDLATAGQCWIWFREDKAMAELRRVLEPGGLLVVAHYSYLPRLSKLAGLTEELILKHNPGWSMADSDGMFPEHIDTLAAGGFRLVEQFCYHHDQPFTHESWRGRIRTCNGVGSGAMSDSELEAFDAELQALLVEEFPEEPLHVVHRVWAVVVQRS